jgi:hypothetical protein
MAHHVIGAYNRTELNPYNLFQKKGTELMMNEHHSTPQAFLLPQHP